MAEAVAKDCVGAVEGVLRAEVDGEGRSVALLQPLGVPNPLPVGGEEAEGSREGEGVSLMDGVPEGLLEGLCEAAGLRLAILDREEEPLGEAWGLQLVERVLIPLVEARAVVAALALTLPVPVAPNASLGVCVGVGAPEAEPESVPPPGELLERAEVEMLGLVKGLPEVQALAAALEEGASVGVTCAVPVRFTVRVTSGEGVRDAAGVEVAKPVAGGDTEGLDVPPPPASPGEPVASPVGLRDMLADTLLQALELVLWLGEWEEEGEREVLVLREALADTVRVGAPCVRVSTGETLGLGEKEATLGLGGAVRLSVGMLGLEVGDGVMLVEPVVSALVTEESVFVGLMV